MQLFLWEVDLTPGYLRDPIFSAYALFIVTLKSLLQPVELLHGKIYNDLIISQDKKPKHVDSHLAGK